MENFIFHIPTKIYFGRGKICQLKDIMQDLGLKKVLLVYGNRSIKENNIYDDVIDVLKLAGLEEIFELQGITPNPEIESVRKGVFICKKHSIDGILAVGGGSVIDCSKMVAVATFYQGDPWDLVMNPRHIKKALPLITVLTVAGTGSEMSYTSVISDTVAKEKIAVSSRAFLPVASILDPLYTCTVPKDQTFAGIVDAISHATEIYFSDKRAIFQEHVTEAVIKTCIESSLTLLENPTDYEARANVMWASSWAMNGFLRWGKPCGWTCHPIEHEISAICGSTHGKGLAILLPAWLDYIEDKVSDELLSQYLHNACIRINNRDISEHLGTYLRELFHLFGMPKRLSEIGIENEKLEIVAEKAYNNLFQPYVSLTKKNIIDLLQRAY